MRRRMLGLTFALTVALLTTTSSAEAFLTSCQRYCLVRYGQLRAEGVSPGDAAWYYGGCVHGCYRATE